MESNPTILGDLLPVEEKSDCSSTVLDLPLDLAYSLTFEIDKADWPEGFNQQHFDELEAIHKKYLEAPKFGELDTPYWNKTPELIKSQAEWARFPEDGK